MRQILTVCAAAALAICAGCADENSNTAVEDKIEEQAAAAGQNVDVDIDDDRGTFRMETEDGRMVLDSATGGGRIETDEGTVAFGAAATLPANFPDDVPLYPNLELQGVSTMSENDGFVVQGAVAEDFDTIAAYYEKELGEADWTQEASSSVAGMMRHMAYTKNDRTLNLTLTKADTEDGASTMVNLVVGDK